MAKSQRVNLRRVYLLSASIALIVTGWLIWTHFKYKFANSKIREAVSEKTGGLYRLHYDSLVLDEVAGSVFVTGLDLLADTAQYASMVKDKINPPVLLTIHVPQLTVLRVQTPKALMNKEIAAGKINIEHASIQVELSDFFKDSTEYSPAKEIYKQILGQLKSIRIDSIQISHSTLIVKDIGSGRIRFSGTDFSILLTNLLIDSIQKDDSSRILFSRNLVLACRDISFPSKDKKYMFQFEGIGFNSADNLFFVDKLNVIPRLSESEFAKESRVQKDRFDIHLQGIKLYQINREALWHKRIEADTLLIKNGSIKVFRDLSYPHDSVNRVGSYPQQQIKNLPIPVLLKKLICHKCFIEYKEKNARSDSSGKVQFVDTRATISNITNIPRLISVNNHCVLDFKSRFLNKATFNAKLSMVLHDRDGKFTVDGFLSPLNATDVNILIQPMALAKLERGKIDKIDLHFTGNNFGCHGKLLFLYRDIKVTMLKKDQEENKYKKKGFASFAANLVVKNSNPEDNRTRVASPKYDRDHHKSIFNLMWKTLFVGIKETAGIK